MDKISESILWIIDDEMFPRIIFYKLIVNLFEFFYLLWGLFFEFLFLFFIFLFWVFMIHDTILLPTKMCAKEAVLAVLKPVRKEAIRWAITEEAKCTFVGIYTVLAFVAILAPFYLITVKTIFTIDNPFWIVNMFWIGSVNTEIAIFDMICVVSKFCIFTVFCKEIDTRHTKLKWLELFKKWCIKIKLCPIVYRGPVISPPYFLIIDGIGFIGRVNWDNLVSRLVTFSMIEFSLVSKY